MEEPTEVAVLSNAGAYPGSVKLVSLAAKIEVAAPCSPSSGEES